MLFVLLLFVSSFSFVHAQEIPSGDVLSPSSIDFVIEPGEEFEYDLSFYSREGGEYEFSFHSFVYKESGNKDYAPYDGNIVQTDVGEFTMESGEHRYIPVKIRIPEEPEAQYYFSQLIRRKSQDLAPSRALSGLLFLQLRQGDDMPQEPDVMINDVYFQLNDEDEVQVLKASFVNNGELYRKVIPNIRFLNGEGETVKQLKSTSTLVFSEFERMVSVPNYSGETIVFAPPLEQAVLTLYDVHENILDERAVEMQEGAVFAHTDIKDSPIPKKRIRKSYKFLYHPIFQGFAILIGLTLIFYGAFMSKSK